MKQLPYLGRVVRLAPFASILLSMAIPSHELAAESRRSIQVRGIGSVFKDLFYGETSRPEPERPEPRPQGRRYSLDRPAPARGSQYEAPPAPREAPPAPRRESQEVPPTWRRADERKPQAEPSSEPARPATPKRQQVAPAPQSSTPSRRNPSSSTTTTPRSSESSNVTKPRTSPPQTVVEKPARRESILKPSTRSEVATKPSAPVREERPVTPPSPPARDSMVNSRPASSPATGQGTSSLTAKSEEIKLPASSGASTPPRETSPSQENPAPAKPSGSAQILTGTKTSVPGRVKSPYPPNNELDVTGLASGSLAMDPTTKKVFRVP